MPERKLSFLPISAPALWNA